MKKLLIILTVMVGLLRADEDTVKLLLDLTTSDIGKFERTMLKGVALNKAYYQSKFKDLEVVAMIHGDAYKFFVKDLSTSPYKDDTKLLKVSKDFAVRIKSLHDTYKVKFLICEAGMKHRSIKKDNIFDFVEVIPNAMIGLIDAQNDGAAYVPVK